MVVLRHGPPQADSRDTSSSKMHGRAAEQTWPEVDGGFLSAVSRTIRRFSIDGGSSRKGQASGSTVVERPPVVGGCARLMGFYTSFFC